MKLKNIFISALAVVALASCSDKMDYKEFSIYDASYMQKKFERAGGFLSTIYADLDSDFGNYSGAMLSSATDESVYSHSGLRVSSMVHGAQPMPTVRFGRLAIMALPIATCSSMSSQV